MRIQIASDLHLEAIPTAPSVDFRRHLESGALRVVERSARRPLPLPEAFEPVRDRDVLVLAGDIGREALAREFVEAELSVSPVIYVPGNHEYYSERSREEIDLEWRWLAGEHGCHSARAFDADQRGNLLISFDLGGQNSAPINN